MGKKFKSIDDIRDHIDNMEEEGETVVDETTPEPEAEPEKEEPKPEEETPEPEQEEVKVEEPEAEPVVEPEAEPEQYIPNTKYKSMGEEHEFDDFLVEAIKTPEQEEAVKRLYEKASGLEHLETKNTMLKEQMEGIQPELDEGRGLKQEVGFYNNLIGQKKYHELFRSINIKDEDILNVAHTILQYKELTPQQQGVYDSNIQSHQRLHQLELQTHQLQQQVTDSNQGNHAVELDQILNDPSTMQAVSAYDTRLGENGAFKKEVINRAAMLEQQSEGKNILTPKQAVDQVLKIIGHVAEPQSTQASSSDVVNPETPPSQVVVPTKKPTLPNVKGSGKSPAKKVFKSIADLRKLADTLDEY